MPDHSTFSKNRHGRFRDSDLLRRLFETVLARCIAEGLVGGEGFAVDASLIKADANRQKGVEGTNGLPPESVSRAAREYLAVLDDAAFGAATPVVPKLVSPADPAARWTGADGGLAYFAYAANYLIDLDHAVIVDVEPTTAIRQAEVTAAKRMIVRSRERFDLYPARLAGDSGYGSAAMLGWLVHEQGIEPHIPVFDKSERRDGTFSRSAFTYDPSADAYTCPAGKHLRQRQKVYRSPPPLVDADGMLRYRASKHDCDACALKPRCCPNASARKIPRSIHEAPGRWRATSAPRRRARTSRRERKKVEMLFAHLKRDPEAGSASVAGAGWSPGRIPPRGRRPEPTEAGQADPAGAAEPSLIGWGRPSANPPSNLDPGRPRVFQRNPPNAAVHARPCGYPNPIEGRRGIGRVILPEPDPVDRALNVIGPPDALALLSEALYP